MIVYVFLSAVRCRVGDGVAWGTNRKKEEENILRGHNPVSSPPASVFHIIHRYGKCKGL